MCTARTGSQGEGVLLQLLLPLHQSGEPGGGHGAGIHTGQHQLDYRFRNPLGSHGHCHAPIRGWIPEIHPRAAHREVRLPTLSPDSENGQHA